MMKKNLFIYSVLAFVLLLSTTYYYFSQKISAHKQTIEDLTDELQEKGEEIAQLEDQLAYYREKEKNLQSLNRRRSRSKPASIASSKDKGIEKKTKPPLEEVKEKKNEHESTEAKDFRRSMMINYVSEQYQELYDELGLSKEETEKMNSIFVKNYELQQDLMFKLFDPKATNEEILKKQEEYYNKQRVEVDNLLEPQQLDMLDAYNKTLPEKNAKKSIGNSLQGLNLGDDDRAQVIDIIYDEGKNNSSEFNLNQMSGLPLEVFNSDNIGNVRSTINQMKNPDGMRKIIDEEKRIIIEKISPRLASETSLGEEDVKRIIDNRLKPYKAFE